MKNLYLLAVLPPAQLSEQINEIRKECAEKFNVRKGLIPPVHITLFRTFFLERHREEWLLHLLQAARHHVPFELELENFGSFNNQTLFIEIPKNLQITLLQKNISAIMNKNKIDPREVKGNTLFRPHVTIAYRDIPPETFPLIWEEYKNRKFKRSFRVDHFTLLKHDTKQWNVLKEYKLEKQEVLTLFS